MAKRAEAVLGRSMVRARRRVSTRKKRIKTVIALFGILILSVAAVGGIYLLMLFMQVSRTLPSIAEVGNLKATQPTRIYYQDGPLMAELATENLHPIKLNQVGKNVIDATIATEDSRFYEHHGVDYQGVVRAFWRDVTTHSKEQGASTITQQLARNINELGLTREKKFTRKIAEAMLAIRIEQTFDKREILELYLNQIYYGAGANGVEAGAETYFHKPAKKLSIAEAALLAGMPQRPSYYSSPEHRDAALRRRNWVLDRMYETGKITAQQRDKAKAEPLKVYKPEAKTAKVYGAPYFVNYVISQLANDQGNRTGYGEDAVLSGWKIYTTLDSRIQRAAEQVLKDRLNGDPANQGCLICLDPRTGAIRAMVGGMHFKQEHWNFVTQGKRPPGSSFKPIVYTSAIDTGKADLDTVFVDSPDLPVSTFGGWEPKNYGGKYTYGGMTVLEGLTHSVNTIAVKTALASGLHNVIDYAHKMGITTEIQPFPPIALGADAVHPIDLCTVYCCFPNGGHRVTPYGIKRVYNAAGDLITDYGPQLFPTGIKASTLDQMNEALQNVVLHGTGIAAADVPNAHGKTGTTSDNLDAWFAGYTPELTAVIWAAHENRGKSGKMDLKKPYLEMPGTTGGHLCAPMWRDFMLKAIPVQQAVNKATHNVMPPMPQRQPDEDEERRKRGRETRNPDTPSGFQDAALDPTTAQPAVVAASAPPGTTAGMEPSALNPQPPPIASSPAPLPPPAIPAPAPRRSDLSVAPPPLRRPILSAPREAEPPPIRRIDPRDEMVMVRLCADTGRRATKWCDATIERRMRRRDVPGLCRAHGPPPGEE